MYISYLFITHEHKLSSCTAKHLKFIIAIIKTHSATRHFVTFLILGVEQPLF